MKNFQAKKWVGVGVVALALLVGGTALATRNQEDPEITLTNALEKFEGQAFVEIESTFTTEARVNELGVTNVRTTLLKDTREADSPNLFLDTNLDTSLDGDNINLKLELTLTENQLFATLQELELEGFSRFFDTRQIVGVPVQLNSQESLESLETFVPLLPGAANLLPEDLDLNLNSKASQELQLMSSLSPDQIPDIISEVKKRRAQTIDGERSTRVTFEITRGEIERLLQDLAPELADRAASRSSLKDELEHIEGTLWINQETGLPNQLTLEPIFEEKDSDWAAANPQVVMTFGYETREITIPENAVSLQRLIESVIPPQFLNLLLPGSRETIIEEDIPDEVLNGEPGKSTENQDQETETLESELEKTIDAVESL